MKISEKDLPALRLLAGERPLVIGHRGYSAVAPENTLPSFTLALEAGADLVELDYHLSKDGVPVVIHDETLDRTTDVRKKWNRTRIKVSDKTAAELQMLDAGSWFEAKFAGTKIPLLTEALDLICGSGGVALIEHKSGIAATCVRILRERNLINKVVVISFDWKFVRQFHKLEPRQILGALGPASRRAGGGKPSGFFRKPGAKWLEEVGATGARIAIWNRQVSKSVIALAHQRGLKVWVYTVDDPKLARRLAQLGADGIITNKSPLIRDALERR